MKRIGETLYNLFMYPLEQYRLKEMRQILLEDVAGDVLEIGYGTGANVPYYNYEQLDAFTMVDAKVNDLINLALIPKTLPLCIGVGDIHNLSFPDESFDSVVISLVLCSVDEPEVALKEVYRVLRKGGRIYFLEHVKPTTVPLKSAFNYLTPLWKRVANNCHLNRDTITSVQKANFRLVNYHRELNSIFAMGIGVKE